MEVVRIVLFCNLFPYYLAAGYWQDAIEKNKISTDQMIQNGLQTINERIYEMSKGVIGGVKRVIGTPLTLKDFTFHIVTSKNPDNAAQIDFYKPGDIWGTKGKIYFIIHGWQQSKDAEWIRNISKILVTRLPDAKVVQVDWQKHAGELYSFSVHDTEEAGDFVGSFINLLTTNYGVPTENIVLIGHSLGAQITGFAGKKFQELNGVRLPRIIALDPAGPLFTLRPVRNRLNEDDADVVMVMHTDADKLGFAERCGTIDFFPNGGESQPGCWDIDVGNLSTYAGPVTCDHSRAWQFFMEAIEVEGSFPARRCKSYEDFEENQCDQDLVVAMSDLETREQGKFYLQTNDSPPYSKPLDDK